MYSFYCPGIPFHRDVGKNRSSERLASRKKGGPLNETRELRPRVTAGVARTAESGLLKLGWSGPPS